MMRLLILAAFVSIVFVGCDDAETSTAPIDATSATSTVSGDAEMVNCVVCGDHEFPRERDTATVSYEGEEYFFCSDYCRESFEKQPAQYVSAE